MEHLSIDRFGFIHDRTVAVNDVCAYLAEFTRIADPDNKGCGVVPDNVAVYEIELAGPDPAWAILYTICRFALIPSRSVIGDIETTNVSSQLRVAADRSRFFVSTITGADFVIAYEPIFPWRMAPFITLRCYFG